MPSSQRPFFLSSFLAAFRQQPPSTSSLSASSQPKTHTHTTSTSTASAASRAISTAAAASSSSSASPHRALPLHSPRAHGVPIPQGGPGSSPGRRRGSDSSSEGFRDVLGGEKWYVGGRTAGGEEKFFKLGVVKRVRSNDRLSLDRLSL